MVFGVLLVVESSIHRRGRSADPARAAVLARRCCTHPPVLYACRPASCQPMHTTDPHQAARSRPASWQRATMWCWRAATWTHARPSPGTSPRRTPRARASARGGARGAGGGRPAEASRCLPARQVALAPLGRSVSRPGAAQPCTPEGPHLAPPLHPQPPSDAIAAAFATLPPQGRPRRPRVGAAVRLAPPRRAAQGRPQAGRARQQRGCAARRCARAAAAGPAWRSRPWLLALGGRCTIRLL